MPDITMCTGDGCPFQDECYRYTATPGYHQSYFAEIPLEEDGQEQWCEHFMREEKSERRTRG